MLRFPCLGCGSPRDAGAVGPEALMYEECGGRAGAGIALCSSSVLCGDLVLNLHTAKLCLLFFSLLTNSYEGSSDEG